MNLQGEFLMSLCFAFDVCHIVVFRPGERLPMKKGGTQNIKSQASRHTSTWNMQSSNIILSKQYFSAFSEILFGRWMCRFVDFRFGFIRHGLPTLAGIKWQTSH